MTTKTPETFHQVFVEDAIIERFIDIMIALGKDPMTCTALLSAAHLYIYDNGAKPGISLDDFLESFAQTVRALDANRNKKS